MIIEATKLANFEYKVTLANKIHNALIKLVVGKKAVALNISFEPSTSGQFEAQSCGTGMYIAGCYGLGSMRLRGV